MAAEHLVELRTRLKNLRGMAVMMGPSFVLEGLLAASVLATSAAAWGQGRRRGQPLLRLAAVGALFPWAYQWLLRPKLVNWGATPEELRQTLPGDELVPHPDKESTHAITLRARPEDVWPWLVQLGLGRGGFYSYDWLEKLAGFPITSADRILPEHQRLEVGEPLSTTGEGFIVRRVDPQRALVVGNPESQDFSWAFVLQPQGAEHTRLLARIRASEASQAFRIWHLVVLPHFFMQWKMNQGLRRRAERTARERQARAPAGLSASERVRPVPEQPRAPRT